MTFNKSLFCLLFGIVGVKDVYCNKNQNSDDVHVVIRILIIVIRIAVLIIAIRIKTAMMFVVSFDVNPFGSFVLFIRWVFRLEILFK